jgi:hypothetical protein
VSKVQEDSVERGARLSLCVIVVLIIPSLPMMRFVFCTEKIYSRIALGKVVLICRYNLCFPKKSICGVYIVKLSI